MIAPMMSIWGKESRQVRQHDKITEKYGGRRNEIKPRNSALCDVDMRCVVKIRFAVTFDYVNDAGGASCDRQALIASIAVSRHSNKRPGKAGATHNHSTYHTCDTPEIMMLDLRKVRTKSLAFKCEISREPLNGVAPNSQRRRVWSVARTSLKVKVKGQGHQGQKRYFSPLSVACVRFTFGKTSLASIVLIWLLK